MAARHGTVADCVSDGSYLFANPAACHQIAEAQDLPAALDQAITVVREERRQALLVVIVAAD